MVGGAFFLSAAQAASNNQLIKQIAINLSDIDPSVALEIGATQIHSAFMPAQVPLVLNTYMTGLKAVFAIIVAAFGVATIIGFFGSWKRLWSEDIQKITGGAA
jgi:ABC-type proline/glycine betaine transport system permease subunit